MGTPVLQESEPALQGLGLVEQPLPATQPIHEPAPLQTWLVPQDVPPATLDALSTQVAPPVAQDVVPTLQAVGLPEQPAPAVQLTHPPPLQTRLVPQLVPADFALPSTHVCEPVLHDVVPL